MEKGGRKREQGREARETARQPEEGVNERRRKSRVRGCGEPWSGQVLPGCVFRRQRPGAERRELGGEAGRQRERKAPDRLGLGPRPAEALTRERERAPNLRVRKSASCPWGCHNR